MTLLIARVEGGSVPVSWDTTRFEYLVTAVDPSWVDIVLLVQLDFLHRALHLA